jgi:hypothetical protein
MLTYPTIKVDYFPNNQKVIISQSSWAHNAHNLLLHNENGSQPPAFRTKLILSSNGFV